VNVHFGGSLSTVDGHVDREHEVSIADAPVADAPTQVTTNSYHGYGVTPDGVADSLRVAGRCRDGTVEWLYHDERPVSAIMWHPERESPSAALDRRIIQQSLGNGSR
jgi:putative glutamine amidotransferase